MSSMPLFRQDRIKNTVWGFFDYDLRFTKLKIIIETDMKILIKLEYFDKNNQYIGIELAI